MQICKKCNETKDLTEFRVMKTNKNKRINTCSTCEEKEEQRVNALYKKYEERNKIAQEEYEVQRYHALKKIPLNDLLKQIDEYDRALSGAIRYQILIMKNQFVLDKQAIVDYIKNPPSESEIN